MRRFFALVLLSLPGVTGAQMPVHPKYSSLALPDHTIAAVIDGEVIRMSEVEEYSRTKDPKKLFQLNQQLFEFRESMLSLMLGERLLKLEADKAGLTVEAFLDQTLVVEPVTEEEIQDVIKRQPPGTVNVALATPLIKQFLEQRKREQERERYIAALIAKARKGPKPLVIHLQPPRQAIPLSPFDPVKGAGAVEVVEFSDFECPFCAKVQPVLKAALAQFDGKVRHIWRDYPLPIHANAMTAAIAARCAGDQGMFWKYHDLLFANQQALSERHLKEYARVLGLDAKTFDACLDEDRYRDEITASVTAAGSYPVTAIPTVFINGRIVIGVAPLEVYTRIIREELGPLERAR